MQGISRSLYDFYSDIEHWSFNFLSKIYFESENSYEHNFYYKNLYLNRLNPLKFRFSFQYLFERWSFNYLTYTGMPLYPWVYSYMVNLPLQSVSEMPEPDR